MLFPTIEFVIFALFSLSLWLFIPKDKLALKTGILCFFNLFFYGFYKPEMVLYLLGWSTIIWLSGKYLKWRYLIIGFAILQLVFFRAVDAHLITFSPIATPLGISFFTFQGLTYLFARMKLPKDKPEQYLDNPWNWFKIFAFTGFFPTVLSGPILRARQWDEQFSLNTELSLPLFNKAMCLIAIGTFYKLCLSSIFHDYASLAFAHPQDETGLTLLIGMYAYTFEIYHDFAGYSLMAIGIALLFGFQVPDNFKQPYLSLNIRDFWQKWHISFSLWLRDYFYFTLGGSRQGTARHLLNTMIVMVVCGAWHGLSNNYLIWGAMHGVAICFYHLIKKQRNLPKLLAWFITFNYVALGWIFFRSPDALTGWNYIHTLFSNSAWQNIHDFNYRNIAIFSLFAFALVCQVLEKKFFSLNLSYKISSVGSVALWAVFFILILIVSPSGMPPFIYFSY
jgi:alginate O-acetyltransferase complex protein AlgI